MNKTIRMINSWDELTIEKNIKLENVYSSGIEPEKMAVEAIAVLCDEDIETIEKIPYSDFVGLATQLEFLKHKPVFSLKNKVEINGHKYFIINDLTKVTTGQYFDSQTLLKQFYETKDEEVLYKLLSLFIIPEGKEYLEGYDIETVIEDVKNLPVAVAEGLQSFFIRCQNKFGKIILNSLLKEVKDPKKKKELKKKIKEIQMQHMSL